MNDKIEEAAKENIEKNNTNFKEAEVKQKNSLGTAKPKQVELKEEAKKLAAEVGYKPIPLSNLPSKGMFYPIGTEIVIKSASVREIRHWSTLEDDADDLTIDEMLNFIMDACVRVKMPGLRASYKDIKEIDRFYLIFAIRQWTFIEGENKLIADVNNPSTNKKEKVEVTKDVLKLFDVPEELMKYYSEEYKCFVFNNKKTNKIIKINIPSLGLTNFMKDYNLMKLRKNENVDRDFGKFAPFILDNWRGLTDKVYEAEMMKFYNYSETELSLLSYVYSLIKSSINPQMEVTLSNNEEVVVPLSFRGGLKAIFIIPDILEQFS